MDHVAGLAGIRKQLACWNLSHHCILETLLFWLEVFNQLYLNAIEAHLICAHINLKVGLQRIFLLSVWRGLEQRYALGGFCNQHLVVHLLDILIVWLDKGIFEEGLGVALVFCFTDRATHFLALVACKYDFVVLVCLAVRLLHVRMRFACDLWWLWLISCWLRIFYRWQFHSLCAHHVLTSLLDSTHDWVIIFSFDWLYLLRRSFSCRLLATRLL